MVSTLEQETMATSKPQAWRWTREQYYRIAETGLFDGKRVELINGEIIEVCPVESRRWVAFALVADALRGSFGEKCCISVRCPLPLSDTSEPEPDIAVFPGSPRDYAGTIPGTASLVIEISGSTLAYDRTDKASLYD
ncbi:MAG: Uma2 family endonuclease [Abitibacteriaceae bacterium]|nr:Uma2 family endonuclease [Abditibacteriaceae bacterium]MBV9863772.1 Uma2 family endonuclease [Abditibacteriaceae bacterium]